AEVVVGAEVQHPAAVGQFDLGRLRAGDDPFGLEQALLADVFEGLVVSFGQGHAGSVAVFTAGRAGAMPAVAGTRGGSRRVNSSSIRPCRSGRIPSGRTPSGIPPPGTGG